MLEEYRAREEPLKMNMLEKAISLISPAWGYKRASFRKALRNYDAGSLDRLNAGWSAVNATAEQTNQGQRDIIRARARDLERNADMAESIILAYERNVIGTGIRLQAKVMKSNKEENATLNEKIEELWLDWSKAKHCDITGQRSFNEMLALTARRKMVDGGIFIIFVYTHGEYSLKLQMREVDELDTTIGFKSGSSGNTIVNGVEVNSYNKPVGYYFKKYTPDGYYTGEYERIPADRIIFLFRKTRPSQIREISQLSRTITRVRDTNEFMEAVSVKERILACLSVFIKKEVPTNVGRNLKIDQKSGMPARTIAPGMIQELMPGEDVTVVNPSGQASNAKEFIQIQQRFAGAGQGLSYEAIARDLSQVNYSSARQGLLEDQRTYKMEQEYIIEHLCDVVYEAFITSCVLEGKLKIRDFFNNKLKYLKHKWITAGWGWIDPVKEVKANQIALQTHQTTLAKICAERGEDWRDIIKQRSKEEELINEIMKINGGDDDATTTNTTNEQK